MDRSPPSPPKRPAARWQLANEASRHILRSRLVGSNQSSIPVRQAFRNCIWSAYGFDYPLQLGWLVCKALACIIHESRRRNSFRESEMGEATIVHLFQTGRLI